MERASHRTYWDFCYLALVQHAVWTEWRIWGTYSPQLIRQIDIIKYPGTLRR